MNNPVSWWEIQAPDLDTAKKFYGEVFGWTFQAYGGMDGYELAHAGDTMVGALHRLDGGAGGRHIHVVFDADARADHTLEDMLAAVTAAGGTVVQERTLIAEGMGWFATVSDPSGLVFDLSSSRPKV